MKFVETNISLPNGLSLFCLPKKVTKKGQKIPKLPRARPMRPSRDFWAHALTGSCFAHCLEVSVY